MLKMELPCKRKREGQKKLMDVMKADMLAVGMTEEDAKERRWNGIYCSDL